MPPRARRLAVGQRWICYAREDPTRRWRFTLIHRLEWQGAAYFVGLKDGPPPDSLQLVLFDQRGQEVNGIMQFYLVRRVRRRAPAARSGTKEE
jgi:hypothetical protein